MPTQAAATTRAASQPGSTRRKPLHRCKARRAERKEHRHGCTERGCKLDRDSVQPRSTFRSSYLELTADEQ